MLSWLIFRRLKKPFSGDDVSVYNDGHRVTKRWGETADITLGITIVNIKIKFKTIEEQVNR